MPNGDYEQEMIPDEIVQHDGRGDPTHHFPIFAGAPQYLPRATNRGDYEKRVGENGKEILSGNCAAGDGRVEEGDPYVVRYAVGEVGGIFHTSCEPTGPQWYGVAGGDGE